MTRSALGALQLIGVLLLVGDAAAQRRVAAPPTPGQQAARLFQEAQRLYVEGRYTDAIREFEEAHRLAPHPSVLFNIGRCHESLGNVAKALSTYQHALQTAKDDELTRDLQQRIARLREIPVKVFVSTDPPGATVTLDGRQAPEAGRTPLMLTAKPGEHVLLLAREGYQLTTHRIVAEPGKDLPINASLEKRPTSCPPPPPPCPPATVCPDTRLVQVKPVGVHATFLGAITAPSGRRATIGPGAELRLSINRWLAGLYAAFSVEDEASIPKTPDGYTSIQPRWVMALAEGGYLFPFRHAVAYATLGVGFSVDRVVFLAEGKDDRVKEAVSFTSALGGGVDAYIMRWLSLGAGFRFGVAHGDRANRDNPAGENEKAATFVYGSILWNLGFHL